MKYIIAFFKKEKYFFKASFYFLLCFSIMQVLNFILEPYKIMGIDKFFGFLLVCLYITCFKKAYAYFKIELERYKFQKYKKGV